MNHLQATSVPFYNYESQWVQFTIRIHSRDNKQTTFVLSIQMCTFNAQKW